MNRWDEVEVGDVIEISRRATIKRLSMSVNHVTYNTALDDRGFMIDKDLWDVTIIEKVKKPLKVRDVVNGLPDLPSGSVVCVIPEQRGGDTNTGRWARMGDLWFPVHRLAGEVLGREPGFYDRTQYVIEFIGGN